MKMKYLVVIPDGAADWPVPALGGKTPLQAAVKPHLDDLAGRGETGLVRTVPKGMEPGSDVANLSLFGYDPARYYTGRAPLEAASLGVPLDRDDVAIRCNLVSTGGMPPAGEGTVMEDYSAGHIGSDEARRIIEDFRQSSQYRDYYLPEAELHPGVGYRHLLVWHGGTDGTKLVPPHDILGKPVDSYLPGGEGGERLRKMMELSADFLRDHPVNRERRSRGQAAADTFWFWGAGKRPSLASFGEVFGLSGAVISAVDLVNGIAALAGMERIAVPGATGYVDTDYGAKARYALEALKRHDLVVVHIEAPDEAGHQGDPALKVQAIEDVDRKFLGPALEGLAAFGDFRILVAPDHPTPLETRTHAADPVPFVIFPGESSGAAVRTFDEEAAGSTGLILEEGHLLLSRLLRSGN